LGPPPRSSTINRGLAAQSPCFRFFSAGTLPYGLIYFDGLYLPPFFSASFFSAFCSQGISARRSRLCARPRLTLSFCFSLLFFSQVWLSRDGRVLHQSIFVFEDFPLPFLLLIPFRFAAAARRASVSPRLTITSHRRLNHYGVALLCFPSRTHLLPRVWFFFFFFFGVGLGGQPRLFLEARAFPLTFRSAKIPRSPTSP